MRLTRFSDIGLRALLYLGANGGSVSTGELAPKLNVSREHLKKSAKALEQMGVLASTRGRSGGFALAAPAKSVRIGAVLRSMESRSHLVECFGTGSTCPLTQRCPLATTLHEAQEAFYAVLDRYTLQDLLTADETPLAWLPGERAIG